MLAGDIVFYIGCIGRLFLSNHLAMNIGMGHYQHMIATIGVVVRP